MSINGIGSGAASTMGAAIELANKPTGEMTEEQKVAHRFDVQMAMAKATAEVTAATEILKAWGEGQKAIAKNAGG